MRHIHIRLSAFPQRNRLESHDFFFEREKKPGSKKILSPFSPGKHTDSSSSMSSTSSEDASSYWYSSSNTSSKVASSSDTSSCYKMDKTKQKQSQDEHPEDKLTVLSDNNP
eukprot:TRINITY_DN1164_c0_g1_i1.p2 TRINITY_DN1164_c0_g1~~TRINITY_DN1164_c0_g1_i1.p2  ORF type:complete len:129 (+),score=25.81 TRINITY_DN1164_c0_g1_i1:57-389(+)